MAFDDDDALSVADDDEGVNSINITPLVDVCLVLVLIFMVTTPFFSKTLMEVALPRASTAQAEDRENITVSISPEEGFAVNEIPVAKAALYNELRRQLKASGFSFVLIRADQGVPHGEVQDVMKICKRAKVSRIAFATDPRY
jgi:biopolymer transport protein ExbD